MGRRPYVFLRDGRWTQAQAPCKDVGKNHDVVDVLDTMEAATEHLSDGVQVLTN